MASCVNVMDESVGAHLDVIDGAVSVKHQYYTTIGLRSTTQDKSQDFQKISIFTREQVGTQEGT